MLEKHFDKSFDYTLVELDEEVVYLANKYILKNLKSKTTVINTNALRYIEQSQEKFDMICMDVFVDNIIPVEFRQTASLEHLSRLLKGQGILLYNVLRTGFEKQTDELIQDLEKVFPHVWYDQIENNLIIYAIKG